MDVIQEHFLSEFNLKVKSGITEEHKAKIDSIIKEHEDNLEFINKYGEEKWFKEVMKLRLK